MTRSDSLPTSSKIGLMLALLALFCIGFYLGDVKARYRQQYDEPIEVVSVYDGDTFSVNMPKWPDVVGKKIGIRIRGIDAPELLDQRKEVKALAQKAKTHVADRLNKAKKVELRHLSRDKYFRLDADVFVDGEDLGKELIDMGLAKPYDGGTKPKWDTGL